MPVETFILPYDDGNAQMLEPTQSSELTYIYDYTNDQERVIGIFCNDTDSGGMLFIEDHPAVVRRFVEGEFNVWDIFDETNAICKFGCDQISMPIWNREGKCASLIVRHSLSDKNILN
jgi:hypothetical protein